MAIVIFIVLALIYFVFIRPVINPPVEQTPKKVYRFMNMSIFTQNGEKPPTAGYTQVSFFKNHVVFEGQINGSCKINKIINGLHGDIYHCYIKGNSIMICDDFENKEVHYLISDNMGYKFSE